MKKKPSEKEKYLHHSSTLDSFSQNYTPCNIINFDQSSDYVNQYDYGFIQEPSEQQAIIQDFQIKDQKIQHGQKQRRRIKYQKRYKIMKSINFKLLPKNTNQAKFMINILGKRVSQLSEQDRVQYKRESKGTDDLKLLFSSSNPQNLKNRIFMNGVMKSKKVIKQVCETPQTKNKLQYLIASKVYLLRLTNPDLAGRLQSR